MRCDMEVDAAYYQGQCSNQGQWCYACEAFICGQCEGEFTCARDDGRHVFEELSVA